MVGLFEYVGIIECTNLYGRVNINMPVEDNTAYIFIPEETANGRIAFLNVKGSKYGFSFTTNDTKTGITSETNYDVLDGKCNFNLAGFGFLNSSIGTVLVDVYKYKLGG